ncbi:MAG: helix-turn-helix domain-containing protein [Paracoccaceae bacterium]|nr:helix-turn-helix domain-containing protein [Paracoccaceae bacterium]MDE2911971.1 helix-turn-helix domain-containing protein [Paracoccaceae bacterium]
MSEVVAQSSSDRSLTLERGIRILEIFTPENKAITTTEAAQSVGISRAAARRLLLTLVYLGYLSQEKGSFRLTGKVMAIGQGVLAREDRWLKVAGLVVDVSNRMDEPFSISVLDGLRIRFVARDLKRRIHSARLIVGDMLPAHCSAAGKVLLSTLTAEEFSSLVAERGPLEKRTSKTITGLQEFEAELRQVRLKSWATAEDEMEIGTIGIAVPIFDAEGSVVAALAVGSHKKRRTVDELKSDFLPVLQDSADRISSELARQTSIL